MFGYDFGDAVDHALLDSGLTMLLAVALPAMHIWAFVLAIRRKRAPQLMFFANILVAGLVALYFLAQPEYFGDILDFSEPGLAALIAFALVTIAAGAAGLYGLRIAIGFSSVVFAADLTISVLGGAFALLFSIGDHR
jgi:hypothetical protein